MKEKQKEKSKKIKLNLSSTTLISSNIDSTYAKIYINYLSSTTDYKVEVDRQKQLNKT